MKRNLHEWTKRTGEGRRVYRAWTERGEWVIQSATGDSGRAARRRSGDPGSGLQWETEDPPTLTVLKLFREVLWNKYQRGRLAYKLIERVDKLIEDREEEGEPLERGFVTTGESDLDGLDEGSGEGSGGDEEL